MQACVYVKVSDNVLAVIETQELILNDSAIQRQCAKHECGAQQCVFPIQVVVSPGSLPK
jgi:hypothetical protein